MFSAMLIAENLFAQNPFIRDQFTADPSARVFNGRVFVYPSHDIPAPTDFKRKNWFCMEDYHVFSSSNLTEWEDHGVIMNQKNINWVDASTYSMWAPDCIENDGKFYFYFPANVKSEFGKGFGIGVAISDNPAGPFVPQPMPIENVHGIDPNVFIDRHGEAYLYWSQGNIFVARLKENMIQLDSEPRVIAELPGKGLKEGPFVFERKGIYYMTYPHVENKIERLEYAMGDNPMGPFKVTGVIMDESPTGCWTNHHSIIEYNNQWYLFYHNNDLSPKFDKNRSIRIDSLFFNDDGTIKKVIPTLRGVGASSATSVIEPDRYSGKSQSGVRIDFLNNDDVFKGWETTFDNQGWIRYNTVDFGRKKLKSIIVKARSDSGGILEIRLDDPKGLLLAAVSIPRSADWKEIKTKMTGFRKGIHNLVIVSGDDVVEADWIRFTR